MKSIAGPAIAAAQGFEDHKGFAEPPAMFDGPIEREVVARPATGDRRRA
jgi:hypothetical protein